MHAEGQADVRTEGALTVQKTPDGFPICLRCGRPVDELKVEYGYDVVHGPHGAAYAYNGFDSVTISCHGESATFQRW